MSAYKDKNTGKWISQVSYKTWNGEKIRKTKRGFKTKKEALEYEKAFLEKKQGSIEMPFNSYAEVYLKDIEHRIKESTFETKKNIIHNRIVSYFGDMPVSSITTTDVMRWQNELMRFRWKDDKPFTSSYLKTIHNQLSAMFNHAVRYYGLKENPARIVGNMGSEKDIRMDFWTLDEYREFIEEEMHKPIAYYIFQTLFWTGMRLGEMLALTPDDIDFERRIISITKTYHRSKRKDITTPPKTAKSTRNITIPKFLAEDLKDYLQMCYEFSTDKRLFPITKSFVELEIKKGAEKAGVKKIRVHDLRHSHVSLLINMGYSALAIAERMGHESVDITYRYAHLFPTVQSDMAEKLNDLEDKNE